MRKFIIEVSFVSKASEKIEVEASSNKSAIEKALVKVDGKDKDDVIGTKIAYMTK